MISKWDERFLALAQHIAGWSKDPSTKVGAVITDARHRVVSLGFNGFPRGIEDSQARLQDRETRVRMVVHAEENALLHARVPVDGCSIYVWPLPPCSSCMAKLIQAGVVRMVAPQPSEPHMANWSLGITKTLAREAGVKLELVGALGPEPESRDAP